MYFTDYIRKNMDQSRMTRAVFIDLHKAFVQWTMRACFLNLKCKELVWFKSYLLNRKQFVFYADIKCEV